MFFVLSKVLWFVTNPGNMLLLFLLLGMALLWTRRRRAGRWLVSAVAVIGVTLAVVPFGGWLFGALEDRFPAVSTPPARVDGVIVAGGIVDPVLSDDRAQVSVGGAAERLFKMAALAKKYPRARLVFSGGSGSLIYQSRKEADAVKPLLRLLGVDLKRVTFEDKSRNTAENAAFSYRLVKPKKGEVWLLVTSAFHMPRAVGSYRRAGWEVFPCPVDYRTKREADFPLQFNFAYGLGSFGGALHEFLGLLFYWLDGKTDHLFPGPRR